MQKKAGGVSGSSTTKKSGGPVGVKKGTQTVTTPNRTFSKPVNQSACCIIPPESFWDPIQAIRAEHDKSYSRWMPHINLLFPFVPSGQFLDAVAELQHNNRFKTIKPFKIKLERLFFNEGSKYLCVLAEPVIEEATSGGTKKASRKTKKNEARPEDPLTLLHNALLESFPDCAEPSKLFVPHMTIGQFSQDVIEVERDRIQSSWVSIEFMVTEINMIARDSDIFKVKESLDLSM